MAWEKIYLVWGEIYLPERKFIRLEKKLFGKTTTESVQTGLYNGYFHLISGLISEYRKMDTTLIVIGTGPGLDIYEDRLDLDHYMPMLIFEGLSAFCKENSI